jgi:hypothetical protein
MKNLLKRPPLYGKKTLRLAFEFGLVLSEVAKERKVELTSEISTRAENILIQELRDKGFRKTALHFTPLMLAALEVKE